METDDTLPELTRHDATQRDMSRHTLTIKQAADLFATLGVPRSPRSVQRFCELGHLDCIRVKGDKTERYFINPQSVERYAEELQQLESISHFDSNSSRHDATQRDMTRHVATDNAAPAPSVLPLPKPSEDIETNKLREHVGILEKEKVQLQIDLAARVVVINQMADERKWFLEQLTEKSRELGHLEMRLMQIEAPMTRHDASEPDQIIEAPPSVGEGSEDPTATVPVEVITTPAAPIQKKSWLRRAFGA